MDNLPAEAVDNLPAEVVDNLLAEVVERVEAVETVERVDPDLCRPALLRVRVPQICHQVGEERYLDLFLFCVIPQIRRDLLSIRVRGCLLRIRQQREARRGI